MKPQFLIQSQDGGSNLLQVSNLLISAASSIASYNPSYGGFNFQIDGKRKGNTNFIVITLIAGP